MRLPLSHLRAALALGLGLFAFGAASDAAAELPLPTFPDCGTGGSCPSDFDPLDEWELGSGHPEEVGAAVLPKDERPLGSGMWVDQAWSITTGSTDVIVAVLDSGIQWSQGGLLNKHYLNKGELPYPQDASGADRGRHDFNDDGVFNMTDWQEDPRVEITSGDLPLGHADDVLDPSDLIGVFSDGDDADANGYIDDISGWDFFWNDNNPYDEVLNDGYSHGAKEARWSVEEGGNGGGIGSCPNCMLLNLRVSDSFVGDVNNFGNAVLYAVDQGALVVQEALGTLNNTQLAADAIDYAWNEGAVVIASAADETAYHHNFPGANHHTVYLHAIRHDASNIENTTSWVAFSNCTNYGPRLDLSASATGCSSGAVGRSAGIAGLMYSAAQDAVVAGTLSSPLSGNEAYQLLTTSVDDIAFNEGGADPERYPSHPGWDAWFGYGRLNAYQVVSAVQAGSIPPEADLRTPRWFDTLSLAEGRTLVVEGRAAAPRSSAYTWRLLAAGGLNPTEADWVEVAAGSGTEPSDGLLATLSLDDLPVDPAAPIEPYYAVDTNVAKAEKAHVHMVQLRLVVADAEGRIGAMRKAFYVQEDPDLFEGLPKKVGTSLESSPTLVDVDGDGTDDIVFLTSDGAIYVTDGAVRAKPGWPQRFSKLEEQDPNDAGNHLGQKAYGDGEGPIGADQRHGAIASPAIGDLDGDGDVEVVAASLNGELWAWHHDGTPLAGFPFVLDRGLVEGLNNPEDNNYDYGFFGSPALGDLDDDGDLEIVIGAMDSRVYALHHDASSASGFPVELRVTYSSGGEDRSRGERIISSPALGDVDGDGHLEIAVGSNQKTTGTYGVGYLISHTGEIEEGWPAYVYGAYTNALPYVGEGIPGSPTLCDVDGDGLLEVAMHTIADSGKLLSSTGESFANLSGVAADFGGYSNTSEAAALLIMINSGAWGDMDGDGRPDYLVGAMGFDYANGLLDDGNLHNHDHLLAGWSGALDSSGSQPALRSLPGFPRIMEDMQFFLNPALADIDGDGDLEAINGSAGHIVHAYDAYGQEPAGWPKDTGQWILGSPAVGDVDGDGYLDVWTGTRDGYLYGWRTPANAAEAGRAWVGFHNDPKNTGNCATALRTYAGPPPLEEEGCGCGLGSADRPLGWVGTALCALFALFGIRRRRTGS